MTTFPDGTLRRETTFNVCWGGVYLGGRTFMPRLVAAAEGHVVNTSSVNGFWASLGPTIPHTAYSAASSRPRVPGRRLRPFVRAAAASASLFCFAIEPEPGA